MKKIFLAAILVASIFASHKASAFTYPDGTLLKANNDMKIYTVWNGKKRWLRTGDVFNSYNYKWTDIKTASPLALQNLPINNLVRVEGDTAVYALNDLGYKRHIQNPSIFNSYGLDWGDVASISQKELDNYPETNLIRMDGDPKVYYLQNGTKEWVTTAEVFYANNFNWDAIQIVDKEDLDTYANGANVEGAVTSIQPAVSPSATTTMPSIITPALPGLENRAENRATTTPSGTIPATPAVPTVDGGTTPATPAVPAQTQTQDTTAPVISNISATTTQTTAIITWTTNELADSRVVISTSTLLIAEDLTMTTSHNLSLSNLSSGATYSYIVVSKDANGNIATSSVQSFVTVALVIQPTPTPLPQPPTVTITSITPYSPVTQSQYSISSIHIQWDTTVSTINYKKIWRKFGDGDWILIGIGQPNYFDDLNIGTGVYSYKVSACLSGSNITPYDCGPDSNIMTTTLVMGSGSSDTIPPSKPANLYIWHANGGYDFLSWTASTDNMGVAGYNIYVNGTYLKSVCCTTAEGGFQNNLSTTLSYTIAAYDAVGNISEQSSPVIAP